MAVSFIAPHDPLARLDHRSRDLAAAAATKADVVVIGGGVTGCGVALDAASRGLSTVLLESEDLAFGTSRWSSKLAHGGLRYLAHGDVGVAWESAVERAHLVNTIAPHLTHAYAQIIPIFAATPIGSALITRVGLEAGDILRGLARTKRKELGTAHWISAKKAQLAIPAIKTDGLRGAALSWDAQLEDDARLVVAIARTAAAYGARIITHARVDKASEHEVHATDQLTNTTFTIEATHVINATGVWADTIDPSVQLRPSRGAHLLFRAETLKNPRAALMAPVREHPSRFVFLIPMPDNLVLAGITDTEQPDPIPDVPEATEADIAWILDHISDALAQPLTKDDIVGTFAGLRPLINTDDEAATADLSRHHLIKRSPTTGVITVTGGKLTTYRRMAQEVVDMITDKPCKTTQIPLVGAGPTPHNVPQRLIRRFGSEAAIVASYAHDDASLLEPLAPGVPTLGVELIHAVKAEGAITRADVIERRTRIALIPTDEERANARITEILEPLGVTE